MGSLGYDDVDVGVDGHDVDGYVGVGVDGYDVGDYVDVGVDGYDVDGYDYGGDVLKSLDLENLYVNQLCGLLLYLRKHLRSFG